MTPEDIQRRRAFAIAALQGLAADTTPIPSALARSVLGFDVRGTPTLIMWAEWNAYRAWLLADAMMAREAPGAPAVEAPTMTWVLPVDAEVAPIRRTLTKLVAEFGGQLTESLPAAGSVIDQKASTP